MLDKGAVPQELHENRHNDDEQSKHEQVVDCLLLITGLENVKHLFIRLGEKNQY